VGDRRYGIPDGTHGFVRPQKAEGKMRFWVYGLDATTKSLRDPLFIEANDEATARTQACELGMQVEEVEPVLARPRPHVSPPAPPTPKPDAPRRAESASSREQLRRLGLVAQAYGFRLLVLGCLTAVLVLAVRINSQVDAIRSQVEDTRSELKVTHSELKETHSELKGIGRQVEYIRTWMPRR
jgi:hypothetical protein